MAVSEISRLKIARPRLIGNRTQIEDAYHNAKLAKPLDDIIAPELGLSEIQTHIKKTIGIQHSDSLYQGIAMLLANKLQGLVGGSLRPTADIVKAAIQCIGPKEGHRLISGHFFIESENLKTSDGTPFLFADCAVVPEPSARSLAAIAIGAAASYRFFTKTEPKVALLSFSTRDSAVHRLVDRIKEAVALIRKQEPQLIIDGEIQLDTALDRDIAKIKKAEDSPISGRSNVLVFPTLEAGNIGYKLVQRFSKTRIAGPLLWGLDKPMSDLSRGCTVQEIVDSTRCVADMARGGH